MADALPDETIKTETKRKRWRSKTEVERARKKLREKQAEGHRDTNHVGQDVRRVPDAKKTKTREGQPEQGGKHAGKKGAKGQGTDLPEPEIQPPDVDQELVELFKTGIQQRLDGKPGKSQLSEEFKAAIRDAYERDFRLPISELAKAIGVGEGTVFRALHEAPMVMERTRQKRQAAMVEDLEVGLAALATQFREEVDAGNVKPSAKNLQQWAVMFGIIVDKQRLLTGGSTSNVAVHGELTLVERKQKLTDSLDRAGKALAKMGKYKTK